MIDSGSVHVVVVTFDSGHLVRGIEAQLSRESCVASVCVVDNGSSDGTLSTARAISWRKPTKILSFPNNPGFGAACNQGVTAAGEDVPFILFMNPDVRLTAGTLDQLVSALAVRPDFGAVGCSLLREDGTPVASARWAPSLRAIATRRIDDVDHRGTFAEADWLCGALMLWRREAFVEAGGFDEGYFLYYEDVDVCQTARSKGWKIGILGSTSVVHDQGHGRPTSRALRRASRASRRRYARKWHGTLGLLCARVADVLDWASGVKRLREERS